MGDEPEELSDTEKLKIVNNFIFHSPPGQTQKVVDGAHAPPAPPARRCPPSTPLNLHSPSTVPHGQMCARWLEQSCSPRV